MMKIAVCVKEVLDARVPVQVTGPGGEVRHVGGETIRLINPADRAALDVALQLKAQVGEWCRVEAFTVCRPGFEGALYHALARGVDRAERLEPPADPSGPPGTALALTQRLQKGNFDLVCCGDETLDNSSAMIGPLLAELLGWSQVTSICKLKEFSSEKCVLVRKLERGHREVVEVSLPFVATFVPEAAEPRYVSQRLLERARKMSVSVAPAAPATRPDRLLGWPAGEKKVPPRARIKKRFAPDPSLSAADRVKMIMAGGPQSQPSGVSSSMVEGDTSYVVEQLYRFLKHHEFI